MIDYSDNNLISGLAFIIQCGIDGMPLSGMRRFSENYRYFSMTE